MKRDLDLIRQILLELESISGSIDNDGRSSEWAYNAALIIESGLVVGQVQRRSYGPDKQAPALVILTKLTPLGHDFIDSTRSPTVWEKTKGRIEKAGGWTLKLVIDTGAEIVKQRLRESL